MWFWLISKLFSRNTIIIDFDENWHWFVEAQTGMWLQESFKHCEAEGSSVVLCCCHYFVFFHVHAFGRFNLHVHVPHMTRSLRKVCHKKIASPNRVHVALRNKSRRWAGVISCCLLYCHPLSWGEPHGLMRQFEPFYNLYPSAMLICCMSSEWFYCFQLSLLEYDPAVHDMKTLSLHYFEDEAMKDGHCQNTHYLPLLQVDPEGRCAALLIYGSRLVILPFRRDASTSAETDAEAARYI